ncbi:NAD(+)/NADH kinase [bacterium]|nr:NAD(+)/NADH kinase [bacterium]MBR1942977.1 NAD(+)/NADH kinase [bacterium]
MAKIIESTTGEKIDITNVGIFYNKEDTKAYNAAIETANILNLKDVNAKVLTTEEFRTEVTLAFVLGGDGTILKSARFFAPYNIPIFGINLGRLGFLSQSKAMQIREAADYILQGQFRLEDRMMLTALNQQISALNDIVIKGDGFSRTSRMYVHINEHTVCDYLADGIIISTPTGSTAYNLSAGGPVLFPTLDAIVIVPICPHTMSARPIVVPSTEIINITSSQNKPLMKISADGQNCFDLEPNQAIDVMKSKYNAKLLLLNLQKNSFYAVLKEKLHWGMSWQG